MESDGQVLWLSDEENRLEILTQIQGWLADPAALDKDTEYLEKSAVRFRFSAGLAPLTIALVVLSFFGAGLYAFGDEWILRFTFWDPAAGAALGGGVYQNIGAGEYWRLITPIFIHFGFTHIIFNALWLWYLGTMIERHSGASRLLALVFFVGLISNIAQASMTKGYGVFGGMSGVVFGLLSYVWLAQRMGGNKNYQLSDPMFLFMTGYMLLSTFGLFDWLAGGEIADTAHIAGYIAGMISALVIYLFNKPANN